MNRLWQTYSAKFEALSWRERVLVGAALVLPALYLMHAMLVSPAASERRALEAQLQKQRAQLAELEQGVAQARADRPDPEAGLRTRETDLRTQLAQADETIKALYRSLVPAQRVPGVLREMVASDSALELRSLRSLPVAALMPEPAAAPATPDAGRETRERGVYKHGVEITLRGNYNALHGYLARLERAPWTMYWWRAQLAAADEGAALTMTLTINTLSFDRAWLEL